MITIKEIISKNGGDIMTNGSCQHCKEREKIIKAWQDKFNKSRIENDKLFWDLKKAKDKKINELNVKLQEMEEQLYGFQEEARYFKEAYELNQTDLQRKEAYPGELETAKGAVDYWRDKYQEVLKIIETLFDSKEINCITIDKEYNDVLITFRPESENLNGISVRCELKQETDNR